MPPRRRGWGKLRTLGSGRIHASYVSPVDGVRHNAPHTYDNRMDAEAWLANERRLIENEAWTPPADRLKRSEEASVTIETYVKAWIDNRGLAEATQDLYNIHARKRIYPVIGDTPVSELTPAVVRTWWAGMGNRYPTARRHAYNLLRSVMNTAVEDKLLPANPCRISQKTPEERDVEALSIEELDEVVSGINPHYRVPVYLLAWTSLRFGELIELRRQDIADNGTVMKLKVRRGATKIGKTVYVGSTKTVRSKRPVTVPPHVAEMLREHLKTINKAQGTLLFTTTKGQRLSKSAMTHSLKKGYSRIGREDLRIHDLRAVGATYAARAGATTKELMARLGHTTPRMAMKYQMAAEARDEALAEAMTRLWHTKSN